MITAITLANYRSFGTLQRVPLAPITALVGPNNSGKSVFMSMPRWLRRRMEIDGPSDLDHDVIHRPAPPTDGHTKPDKSITIGWESDDGVGDRRIVAAYWAKLRATTARLSADEETLRIGDKAAWQHNASTYRFGPPFFTDATAAKSTEPFFGLRSARQIPAHAKLLRTIDPVLDARLVCLSAAKIRAPVPNLKDVVLDSEGGGAATVLARWRGFDPDRAARLDHVLNRALPDLTRALVDLDSNNHNVLWFQHDNGEKFDASRVSDGVLFFLALAMHVLDAPRGALIFVEEPENGIHPLLMRQIVDLMRTTVKELGCQIVLATHSPTLLLEFRNQPEAIVLFRRRPDGSSVTALSDRPELVEALDRSDPAEMLANGFFNDPL